MAAGLGAKDKGPNGFRVLNVNVGAAAVETAERFKQKDQELQKKNFGNGNTTDG